jgi:hypothetical protein
MDTTAALSERIPGFPGYADTDSRRLADEEVRAYLGEALAALSDRLGPAVGPLSERLESTLLRAEFMNQAAFREFESADLDETRTRAMAAADLAAVELGDRAAFVDAGSLASYLDAVTAALDARERIMRDAT